MISEVWNLDVHKIGLFKSQFKYTNFKGTRDSVGDIFLHHFVNIGAQNPDRLKFVKIVIIRVLELIPKEVT